MAKPSELRKQQRINEQGVMAVSDVWQQCDGHHQNIETYIHKFTGDETYDSHAARSVALTIGFMAI